uniref:Uncharacterized protein n=1 Tax=Plectus sambesii TaxID=2011161 RepID=A0A914VJL8_9BILA
EESIAETDFGDDETKDDEDSVVDDAERTLSRRSRTRSFSGCELEHYRQQHERLEEARPLCNHDSTTSLNDVFLDASNPDIRHLGGGITTIRKRTAPPILLEAPIMRNASSAYSACTTSVGGVTEDGYERDLSEYVPTDDHTLNDSYGVNRSHIVLATHQKHYLNDFWLILTINNNVATVYFCERFAQLHEALFHELQQKLANECRIVNQEMLLEKMNATRECDALIMPEKEVSTPVAERVVRSVTLQKPHVQITEPSTFSPLVRQFVVTRQNTRLLTWTDEEDQSESTSLTGQARFKFAPGYFACDMVWHHWYFVHPRLKSTTRVSSSQPYNQLVLGMKALTMWLEQLAVRNRENLFVFREHSGHVFYLRLHASLESAEQGGVNLTALLSPGAIKSNFNHSILLAVHGLTEPGEEICVKMRDELQRRLDAAVLDELVAMLRRNPNFRMTQLDGKFIQPDESKPCLIVKFTLPTPAINYLYAVAHYLRQHLLTFMHMPKFISASGVRLDEWRFRPYVSGDGADVNFFLLNRPAVAGSSTIGLACIEMAFVDSQGLPYSVLRSAPLDARGHSTFFAGDSRNSQARQARFYELTKTSIWTTTSGQSMKSKGPTALVQFAVWEKGDVGLEGLQERLRHSVQQALADLVTEYGLLTTPMFELAPPVLPGGQSMSCFALATSSPLGSSPSSPRSLHLTHMPVVLPIESERKDSSPQTPLSASLTPPQHPMHHQQGPRNSIDMLDVQVRRQLQMRRKRSSSEALLNPQSATTTSTSTTSTSATTSPPKPLDSPKTPSLIPAKPPLHVVTSNIFNFDQTAGKRHSVDIQSDEFPPFARRKHSSGGESVSSARGGLTTSSEQSSNRPSSSARSSPVKRTSSVRMFNPGGRSDRLNTAFATSAADWFDHIMALSKGQNKTPGSLAKMDWRLDSDAACRKIVHIAYERLHEVIPSTDMVVCEGLISVGPGLPRIDPSILSTPILGDMGRIVEAEDKTLAVLVGYSKALTEDTFAFAQDSSGAPPESLRKLATPNSDSNEQRFSPLLQGFVPRRRLLLVLSRGEKLTLYGYNWSQDAITTISSIFLKLVCWHNARSRLLREIGLHKMGVCHLSIPQKPDVEKNPYLEMTWMYPESLLSDNFPPHRLQRPNFAALKADYARLLLKPFRFIDSAFLPRYSSNCAFTNQTRQFLDLRLRLQGILNEQMIMRQIHETWWNMRLHDDEKICIQARNLQLLHTRSRQAHSVYSPLLLAPKWRRRVAQVRIANEDGAPLLDPNAGRPVRKQIERKKSMPITREALPAPTASAAPQSPVKTRSNTMSGTHRHPPASMSSGAMSPTPMPTPTVVRLGADDDEDPWHVKIQYMLVEDYVKYLKTMDMRLIYVQSADKTIRDPLHYNMLSPESPTVWLEQTVEGGIALMRLSFHEPYFRVELFAWDAGQLRYSTTPVDQEQIDQVHQASVEFDRVVADLTIRCHAHSFLYDFHLRMVTTYLIGGQQVMFTPGYNTNAFLIDFLQYYGCRPAFARNCIYEDKTTFKQLSVAGNFIWEHFLNHERIYEWRVVRMKLLHEKGEQNSDFLLVSTDEYQHFDETYKVVRVVLHDERESGKLATDLRLKFYVLLVSSEHNMPFPELDGPALDENEQQVEEGEFKRLEAGSPCDDDLDEAGEDVDVSFEADDKPSSDLLPIRHATLPSQRRRFRSGGSERQSGLEPLYRIHHKLSSDAESVSTVPSGRFQVSRVLEDDLVSAGDRHLLPQPKLSIRKSAPRRHRKSTNKDWVAVLAKEGAVLPKEQITYVTYVSARQRKLQTTLEDSVTHFKRRLQRTVSDAGWHCKRDQLWTRLLEGGAGGAMAKPRSRNATGGFWAAGPPRIETSGVSTVEAAMVLNSLAAGGVMSMADLETLLGYVRVVPAVEIDPNITPFVANLRDDAMLGLMRCLVIHFGPDRCRFFSPGNVHAGSKKHLVVLNPNFLDSLVLVTVAARTNGAKIFLVYKDWDTLISDSSEDNKAYRISVIQSFFEEVVSCLGYFTWQKLLSE